MTKRLIAFFLVLCLCAGLVATVSAEEATLESSVDMEALIEHGISLFKALEAGGRYDSVANTYCCVGMGIMGWIDSAALQLLRWCCTPSKGGDPDYSRSVLGDALFNEVMNAPVFNDELMPLWGYWSNRTFSSSELAAVRTILPVCTSPAKQGTVGTRGSGQSPPSSTTAPLRITTGPTASMICSWILFGPLWDWAPTS